MLKKSRLTNSFPLFEFLNILPFRHLYFFKTLKLFFLRSGYLKQRIISNYNLRINRRNLAVVPRARTSHFCHFYSIIAPRIFNKLPDEIKLERRLSFFLRKIRVWLLSFNHVQIEMLTNIES